MIIDEKQQKSYRVLGLMSGSSLDGLDIAFCTITIQNEPFEVAAWTIQVAETIPYSETWVNKLERLPHDTAFHFAATDTEYGRYIGQLVNLFVAKYELQPDFIASHGHTVFHYPNHLFTSQIGDGSALAMTTGLPVICNFRAKDIAAGGQGAPLAPVADKYLFAAYHFCLNIGGIINITCQTPQRLVAFDITGANQILNSLATEVGLAYDHNGNLAATGNIIPELLEQSNKLPFLSQNYPKSLGNDWVQHFLLPIFQQTNYPVADRLRTACEHIAIQTALAVAQIQAQEQLPIQSVYQLLPTGGGVYNNFLMQTIDKQINRILPVKLVTPSQQVIEFKEALLIALLGVMRLENVPNSFSSVTGAKYDTINGDIHQMQAFKASKVTL
ncbi:MAG: anhydro-N-acetylmuramic acid kinase [Saprospiraceae bacterium]|nr:anhydro-N-acetylmuramic acid kinase [Saprospiraceae bacterium]